MCLNGSCSSKGKRSVLQAKVASAAWYFMFSIKAPAFDLTRKQSPGLFCLMTPLSAGKTNAPILVKRKLRSPIQNCRAWSGPSLKGAEVPTGWFCFIAPAFSSSHGQPSAPRCSEPSNCPSAVLCVKNFPTQTCLASSVWLGSPTAWWGQRRRLKPSGLEGGYWICSQEM